MAAATSRARIRATHRMRYGRATTGEFMLGISAEPGERFSGARMAGVSWLSVLLLACAVLAVAGAEWPRLRERLGVDSRRNRKRERRKSQLRLVRGEPEADDADDFAASVERDLEQLPTLDESDRR
jgi:hypothetical protein